MNIEKQLRSSSRSRQFHTDERFLRGSTGPLLIALPIELLRLRSCRSKLANAIFKWVSADKKVHEQVLLGFVMSGMAMRRDHQDLKSSSRFLMET